MPLPLRLPDGYTERPLALTDAPAVTAVMAAAELAVLGHVEIEESDIVADWQRPSHDLAARSVGVHDATGRLVAYAECIGGSRADAAVHPDHCGRGIGTALAHWLVARAGELGEPIIGMATPQGSPGDRLLGSLGWSVRWESWALQLPEGASIPDRPLPSGYAIREAIPDDPDDLRACWNVLEDAFLEWSERERAPFADWYAATVGRPGFEPWNLRVVTDPGGDVVAVAVILARGEEGHVNRVATRKDQRRRGLAQALLADCFAAAQARGARTSTLSTDSRTGALSLYLKVGMEVTRTWVHRAART